MRKTIRILLLVLLFTSGVAIGNYIASIQTKRAIRTAEQANMLALKALDARDQMISMSKMVMAQRDSAIARMNRLQRRQQ